MLKKQNHVVGYRNSSVASERVQGRLTPSADLNFDNRLEGVDDNEYWDFDGSIGGKSVQRVGEKHKLLGLQDECRTKNEKVWTNVAGAVELAQGQLRSPDVPDDFVPSSKVSDNAGKDVAELLSDLEKAMERIVEL